MPVVDGQTISFWDVGAMAFRIRGECGGVDFRYGDGVSTEIVQVVYDKNGKYAGEMGEAAQRIRAELPVIRKQILALSA
ncbi:MAG: hypothetical protein UU09_C0050G0006 [Microgenomates group bacterium GW2011_GWA2_40_6]|nr:MAG: hypothetical protein UU09_C0050G0006 [Microgenomates group bacterium GW2011_GWA2_40_6]